MIAGSMNQKNVGSTHIPLQLKQTPPLATQVLTAYNDIRQYQPVYILQKTATAQVSDVQSGVVLSTGSGSHPIVYQDFGVAAHSAKAGESVTVYVNGYFNVHALDLADTAIADASVEDKLKALNSTATGTNIFFGAADTNTVQSA